MDYFIGEIRSFPFGTVPRDWHLCDGSLLSIQQNAALYSLLGTRFGGDGKTTFGLPDLRGRAMLSQGVYPDGNIVYNEGQAGGAETVVIASAQMPVHVHAMNGNSGPGTATTPAANVPAGFASPNVYSASQNTQSNMAADAIAPNLGGQPHNNMQPSLVLNYCIATAGLYPTRD